MDEIENLAKNAEAAPGRKRDAIRTVSRADRGGWLETSDRFDPDRLIRKRS